MQRKEFIRLTGRAALLGTFSLGPAMTFGNGWHFPFRQNQPTEPLAAELEKLIPALMQDKKVPGFSIAIIRDGALSWCKGFGIRDQLSRKPVTEDTVFEIASVSKTVFAYAVMKLCEKGTLNLDTPLVNYVSDRFIENDPRLDLVTARHILSHRSGFQNWRSSDEPLKIHFTPGTDFLYSGEGYFYLQSVVTRLTGKINYNECGTYEGDLKVCATDISDFLVANVLAPHAMNSSGYLWTEAIGKNEALAHDTEGKLISKPHQKAKDMARYASAGGLLTTSKDYASFIIGLFTPRENDSYRLNKNSLMEMVRPQVKLREEQKIDGASSWALGWAVQERPGGNVILHSGGQTGFRSLSMTSLEKKNGFVMLTNGDNGGYILYNPDVSKVLDRLFT